MFNKGDNTMNTYTVVQTLTYTIEADTIDEAYELSDEVQYHLKTRDTNETVYIDEFTEISIYQTNEDD